MPHSNYISTTDGNANVFNAFRVLKRQKMTRNVDFSLVYKAKKLKQFTELVKRPPFSLLLWEMNF